MGEHKYYTYILSNASQTLYVGVTNCVLRRSGEHQTYTPSAFTSKYHFDKVVHVEIFQYVNDAIAREKTIKGWSRAKKLALIREHNPQWLDILTH
jgi:putative endonuclease